MEKEKGIFVNMPDKNRIMAALAECYRITLEKRTGKKYIVQVMTNEDEGKCNEALRGLRAS